MQHEVFVRCRAEHRNDSAEITACSPGNGMHMHAHANNKVQSSREPHLFRSRWYVEYSLVPRPLPDFISQPWRKIGCEIKSGSGLGTRLRRVYCTAFLCCPFQYNIVMQNKRCFYFFMISSLSCTAPQEGQQQKKKTRKTVGLKCGMFSFPLFTYSLIRSKYQICISHVSVQ